MELFRALAVLAESPERPEVGRLAAALGLGEPPEASEHTELFVFQLYPYASVYLGEEGLVGGEARDRVEGFWRALGLEAPTEADHLSVLLAAYARLSEMGEDGGGRRVRGAFLWEHLLSWLPAYLDKLSEIAPPFYRRWGGLLDEALASEAGALGRPEALPLHLRAAPGLADPREQDAEEFLRSLLAPARSGLILTRADLALVARALGAGARAGGRAFVLKSLLGQDAEGVLGLLAAEASRWSDRHARRGPTLGAVAVWWSRRAATTAALLRELQGEAAQAG